MARAREFGKVDVRGWRAGTGWNGAEGRGYRAAASLSEHGQPICVCVWHVRDRNNRGNGDPCPVAMAKKAEVPMSGCRPPTSGDGLGNLSVELSPRARASREALKMTRPREAQGWPSKGWSTCAAGGDYGGACRYHMCAARVLMGGYRSAPDAGCLVFLRSVDGDWAKVAGYLRLCTPHFPGTISPQAEGLPIGTPGRRTSVLAHAMRRTQSRLGDIYNGVVLQNERISSA